MYGTLYFNAALQMAAPSSCASDVGRVMAVANGNVINVLAKLANDVNVSVEIGAARR